MKNYFLLFLLSGAFLTACKKDKTADTTDKDLFDWSKNQVGFVWYKNSDTLMNISSGSAHAYAKLRTRFNTTAAQSLNSSGMVIANAVFAENSLIVKELLNADGSLQRYAIMWKKADNINADENGWVWGYINTDGSVAVSASKKGSSCISCHSQSGNIDQTLMNKYFP